jgi:Holliday junction resolvase
MPNKHYVNGIRKERKLVNLARKQGHIALRSAGSHSPIDVVIVDFTNHKVRLIQCKPESMKEKKILELELEYEHLNGTYEVSFEVYDGTG